MSSRVKRVQSIKKELVKKSRESALAAIQIFNNPNISFKAESYVVLMIIAWTYLFHAYYRGIGVVYRYHSMKGNRRVYLRTPHGAYRYWDLMQCLKDVHSPIDGNTANNLRFMIGLRNEIEHQMTTGIDDAVSAKFQSCCLNYNEYIKELFGEKEGIATHLAFSLQFSDIDLEQTAFKTGHTGLPSNIQGYITKFDDNLSDEELFDQRYAYRVLFTQKLVNHRSQADRVIEFVPSKSAIASEINKEYTVIREVERKKYRPKKIVNQMKAEGYTRFSMHYHTELWKSMNAKGNGDYGCFVTENDWYWYEKWVDVVREYCEKNKKWLT